MNSGASRHQEVVGSHPAFRTTYQKGDGACVIGNSKDNRTDARAASKGKRVNHESLKAIVSVSEYTAPGCVIRTTLRHPTSLAFRGYRLTVPCVES
jgi:hypothetical protein